MKTHMEYVNKKKISEKALHFKHEQYRGKGDKAST